MKLLTLTAALFATSAAVGHAATVFIDTFDSPQRVSAVPSGALVDNSALADASVLGGERDLEVSNDFGVQDGTDFRTVVAGNGVLAFSNIAGSSGMGRLVYDGLDGDGSVIDTDGLGGFDLTLGGLGTGFIYEILFADAQLEINVNAYDTSGGFSGFNVVLPGQLSNQTLVGSFDDFVGDADLTSLGALEFTVTGSQNLDLQVDSIGIAVIPLPAGVLGLGAGLLGLGALGASRRRKA